MKYLKKYTLNTMYEKCKPNVCLYVGRPEKQKTKPLYHKSQETEYLDTE
jgi:hypothetical protein